MISPQTVSVVATTLLVVRSAIERFRGGGGRRDERGYRYAPIHTLI